MIGALSSAMERDYNDVRFLACIEYELTCRRQVVDARHPVVVSEANECNALATHIKQRRGSGRLKRASVFNALLIQHLLGADAARQTEVASVIVCDAHHVEA